MTNNTAATAEINEKAEYKINQEMQIELLDRIYSRTRQKIREKGGVITHDTAMQLVLKQDLDKIKDGLFNEHMDEFTKTDPVTGKFLADKLRNKSPKEREEGFRLI